MRSLGIPSKVQPLRQLDLRYQQEDRRGDETSTLTSNTLIGVATEAVAGGASDLIGRVRLNGAFQ